jgi:Transposase DDE domain group 1
MPTQCSRDLFGYEVVEGRQVVAAFDGGDNSSDAGGLLLGATDRAIGLVARFAACFVDHRAAAQVEHSIDTMVAQRVFGIALGYEDLLDHDHLLGRRNGVGAPFPNPAAKRSGARDPRWQAHCPAQRLRPARRQEHAQPARACAFAAEPLPQDRA